MTAIPETPPADRDAPRRYPVARCPVCDFRAMCRTSEELSPETRRLYYRCDNILCGMTWRALLSFEAVISPSGISKEFRPAHFKEPKTAPGHDYGQLTMDIIMTLAPNRSG